jgi:hypothetical protein
MDSGFRRNDVLLYGRGLLALCVPSVGVHGVPPECPFHSQNESLDDPLPFVNNIKIGYIGIGDVPNRHNSYVQQLGDDKMKMPC